MQLAGHSPSVSAQAAAVLAGVAAAVGWTFASLWLLVYLSYGRGVDPFTSVPFYLFVAGVPVGIFAVSAPFRRTPRSRTIVSRLRIGFGSGAGLAIVFVAMMIFLMGL